MSTTFIVNVFKNTKDNRIDLLLSQQMNKIFVHGSLNAIVNTHLSTEDSELKKKLTQTPKGVLLKVFELVLPDSAVAYKKPPYVPPHKRPITMAEGAKVIIAPKEAAVAK
jgi:hypothetical protein